MIYQILNIYIYKYIIINGYLLINVDYKYLLNVYIYIQSKYSIYILLLQEPKNFKYFI